MKVICYFYANAGNTTKYLCKVKINFLSASPSTKKHFELSDKIEI